MKPIKLWNLLFYIITALASGVIGALLGGSTAAYEVLVKPPFSPPGWVFPAVWTILYILMGIAAYLVYDTRSVSTLAAFRLYWLGLFLMIFWSPLFWRLENYTAAAFLIGTLIIIFALCTVEFYKIRRTAAFYLFPLLLWLCYALYLNIGIVVLN